MTLLFVALTTVLAAESFFWLPVVAAARRITRTTGDVFAVITSSTLTDDEKEPLVMKAAKSVFVDTLKTTGAIFGVVLVAVAAASGLQAVFHPADSILERFVAWDGLLVSIVAATVYAAVRSRVVGKPAGAAAVAQAGAAGGESGGEVKSDYDATSQLLHRIALGAVAEMSFDLEKVLVKADVEAAKNGQHLFISGLARAGTTILMRTFYETGGYRSLTYRDMPFVLAPNIWARFSRLFRTYKEAEERAHGDRIKVNFDSPEAFEEVFWRVMCGPSYIRDGALSPHTPDAETVGELRGYIARVLKGAEAGQTRYLSKNNGNILRLGAIREAFPNATIVVPYRDPLQHAGSLLSQHEHFVAVHKRDAFGQEYMNWLGHHEFGGNQMPFRFTEGPAVDGDRFSLDYWVAIWLDTYRYLLKTAPPGTIFVGYEKLCAEPARVLDAVFAAQGKVRPAEAGSELKIAKAKAAPAGDEGLRRAAYEVYEALQARSV